MLLEGIIRGLELVSDVLEFGPVDAVRINTAFIPEAERDANRIIANINKPQFTSFSSDNNGSESVVLESKEDNSQIEDNELSDENLEKFGKWIEDVMANFSTETNSIDLRLIYKYPQLNAYGKVIMDKINSNKCCRTVDLGIEEQLKMALTFKEQCQEGKGDKYAFVFWALVVLTVDDTDKEEHLSLICDFSSFLGITDEEMMNIMQLIYVVCHNNL